MYFRILKKDLKRKRTMNTILLIFITLATMFIASSANNMLSATTALDSYFEKANVPDYWFSASNKNVMDKYMEFARKNQYDYTSDQGIIANAEEVYIDGKALDYSNTLLLSTVNPTIKVFDSEEREITQVSDGEIYVTSDVFHRSFNDFRIGSKIKITVGEKTKTYTLKDYTKDAMFGSSMIGMARVLISENDYADLLTEDVSVIYSGYVYTDDENYYDKYYNEGLAGLFDVDMDKLRMMYVMDLVVAVVILVVSLCLIAISMVLLRFAIHFTINEDFREVGVMKAIGLQYRDIRGLYLVKYLAISIVGAVIGFLLSIPFGNMLMQNVSRNIIISGQQGTILNLTCAVLTAGIVILFCQCCTAKIKKLSPIDAIRNGQSGERFKRKSMLSLGRLGFSPLPFLAINDILCGIRNFITMIIIFALGFLLIIIPVNTINTLQSDNLITWFSMADCHHVISTELIQEGDGNRNIEEQAQIRQILSENDIPAEVFQEKQFRVILSGNDKTITSIACQGSGDISDDRYVYTEGTAPENENEIALTGMNADRLGVGVGDSVEITNGDVTEKYIITALFQSMNNLGEGLRFYHDKELEPGSMLGAFGIQIRYMDEPDHKTLSERKEILQDAVSDGEVYTAGEYISVMIGDVAGQLHNVKILILIVVLAINILITILIGKSLLTREKREIAILKAIGFSDVSIIAWQTMRIGFVIMFAVLLGIAFQEPLSQLTVGPVFQMMGAQSIEFAVKPWEVFVLYPLVVCVVTITAGYLTALQTRKITASETASIE